MRGVLGKRVTSVAALDRLVIKDDDERRRSFGQDGRLNDRAMVGDWLSGWAGNIWIDRSGHLISLAPRLPPRCSHARRNRAWRTGQVDKFGLATTGKCFSVVGPGGNRNPLLTLSERSERLGRVDDPTSDQRQD